jgi:hypothetical protein
MELGDASTAEEARAEAPILPRQRGVGASVTADVWIPRLEGNSTFGGPTLDLGDDLDLDGTEATFDGVAALRLGLWQLAISGFDFSSRSSSTVQSPTQPGEWLGPGNPFTPEIDWGGVTAPPGSTIESRFAIASAAVEGSWDFWSPLSDRQWAWSEERRNADNVAPDGGYRVDLRLGVLGGARWANIEQTLTVENGGSARYDGDWAAIYGGVRVALDLRIPDEVPVLRKFSLVAAAAAGGVVSGASGSYWQVRAGLEFHLFRHVALSAGYQLVEFDASDDQFTFDGGLQGLWFGGTITF